MCRGQCVLSKAVKSQGSTPTTITLNGYAASHCAVREMTADSQLAADTKFHSSKYLSNLIEQGHRGSKLRIGQMLGFKRQRWSQLPGIELLRRIHRGQFNLGRRRPKSRSTLRVVLCAQPLHRRPPPLRRIGPGSRKYRRVAARHSRAGRARGWVLVFAPDAPLVIAVSSGWPRHSCAGSVADTGSMPSSWWT
jgi:hypothetical protein